MKNSMSPSSLQQRLADRHNQNLYRHLQLPQGVDFCSNDYLGFAQDDILQERLRERTARAVSGSTGSRLLRGHHKVFETLEAELARFCEREAALFFPSGYQANLGLLSALLNKDSLVFSDELNHASIIDGIKLSGASKFIFKHNDLDDLEKHLKTNAQGAAENKFIVVESLYSMTGDKAPLKELLDVAQAHGAQVIVDEAHATGVYGAGLLQKQDLQTRVLASMHSGAKALGVAGAWIACDGSVKEYLINFSRPFIYSTAPSPLVSAALLASLEHWQWVGRERSAAVLDKAAFFSTELKTFFEDSAVSVQGHGAIIYVNLRDSAKALAWSAELQSQGFDIRAIRYPTVPEDQSGLRISIHANHSGENLSRVLQVLKNLGRPC